MQNATDGFHSRMHSLYSMNVLKGRATVSQRMELQLKEQEHILS
jgi:hypothetical protein